MADEVTLLDFWPSPFGMRVRVALALKGIKHEYIEQDLWNKSSLLLEMNPVHKKIPVLIHDGKPVCESMVALRYIDEAWHGQCPLLPSDPYLKSQALFLADYVDKKVFDAGKKLWVATREVHAAAKKEFLEILKVLEGELGDKPFFGGESIGYVDVVFVVFYALFYSYEYFGEFNTEVENPKLSAYFKRCMTEEAIAKSLPDQKKFHEFLLEYRKKLVPK